MKVPWDYEARRDAYDQSQRMATRDPDAAAYLMAHLDLPPDAQSSVALHEPYDPMALLATVAKYYGFSDHDMQHMPYQRFFGYVRQAVLMNEAEQRAMQQPTTPPLPQSPDDPYSA